MSDWDDHNEAMADAYEREAQEDYEHEMAIAEHMAEREANEDAAQRRRMGRDQ